MIIISRCQCRSDPHDLLTACHHFTETHTLIIVHDLIIRIVKQDICTHIRITLVRHIFQSKGLISQIRLCNVISKCICRDRFVHIDAIPFASLFLRNICIRTFLRFCRINICFLIAACSHGQCCCGQHCQQHIFSLFHVQILLMITLRAVFARL